MKMNGHILEGTSICVDYWLWSPGAKYLHFLSHLHSDRTYKLSSTFRGTIYTSPFNSWLVKRRFQIPAERVVSLTLNDPHILRDSEGGFFNVTLIDANHCPGSVMFLFEGTFGNILYTGDFRYTPTMLQNPMLKSLIDNQSVQQLYLDNTFAAEMCKIPSREDALKQVVDLVKMHPDHYIVIGVQRLGQEEVLSAVAKELQEKVLVSAERMAVLKQLRFVDVFTTKSQESRIMAKEINLITGKCLFKLKEEKGPVLIILLSALHSLVASNQPKSKINEDKVLGIHRIPYSDHCSHQELVEFVSKVRPHEVRPIVYSTKGGNPTTSKHKCSDGRKFLEPNCVRNLHKIPESIFKLCRTSRVLKRTLLESLDNSMSEVQSTQNTVVSDDAFAIRSSQVTEDLSNDDLEARSSHLLADLTEDLNTSLVNKLQQMNELIDTTNSKTLEEIVNKTLEKANQPSFNTNTYNELEKIKEFLQKDKNEPSKIIPDCVTEKENVENQTTTDKTMTDTERELNLDYLEVSGLVDSSEKLSDGECEFVSLSQEDLTQIQNHPSTSHDVSSKNTLLTENNHTNETNLKNKYQSEKQHETPTFSESEESIYVSLSQEDIAKLPTQQSISKSGNPIDNNKCSEGSKIRKARVKKKLVLDSDSDESESNFGSILNHAKKSSAKNKKNIHYNNQEENIISDQKINYKSCDIENQNNNECSKSHCLNNLKNKPIMVTETTYESKMPKSRILVESTSDDESIMRTKFNGGVVPTEVDRSNNKCNLIKEFSDCHHLINQEKLMTSTPISFKCVKHRKHSGLSYKSYISPRGQNERLSNNFENISGISKSNVDLNSFAQALNNNGSKKCSEKFDYEKMIRLHSPVSDEKSLENNTSPVLAFESRKHKRKIKDKITIIQDKPVTCEESFTKVSSTTQASSLRRFQDSNKDEEILLHSPMANDLSSVTKVSSSLQASNARKSGNDIEGQEILPNSPVRNEKSFATNVSSTVQALNARKSCIDIEDEATCSQSITASEEFPITKVSSSVPAPVSRRSLDNINDEQYRPHFAVANEKSSFTKVSSSKQASNARKSRNEIVDTNLPVSPLANKKTDFEDEVCPQSPVANEKSTVATVSSSDDEDFSNFELIQNVQFYKDQLEKRIGMQLSDTALRMIANSRNIHAQWCGSKDKQTNRN